MKMESGVRWYHSLKVKLASALGLLLAAVIIHMVMNMNALQDMQGMGTQMERIGLGRYLAARLQYQASESMTAEGAERQRILSQMRDVMQEVEDRYADLKNGNPAAGIAAVSDPDVVAALAASEKVWRQRQKPFLVALMGTETGVDRTTLRSDLAAQFDDYIDGVSDTIAAYREKTRNLVNDAQSLQYAFLAIYVLIALIVVWMILGVTNRTQNLMHAARRIADGNLDMEARVTGEDELGQLGFAFETMRLNLRTSMAQEREARTKIEELFDAVRETAAALSAGTSQILSGTTQQAAGAREQAAAVSQTTSTVEEVLQSANQVAERSRAVADSVQRASEMGENGWSSLEQSIGHMNSVKDQTELIGENILNLAEQAQSIGEIIAAVTDIAEQTNLLAINAGVEAARAGESGAGFSVVAREIKELADEAKKSTVQVRQILSEIQKATNSAVMVMEEGTKRVNNTIDRVNDAGATIRGLVDSIVENGQAAAQISAATNQQVTGMAQIRQAIQDINKATNQNVGATRQTEEAVRNLDDMGGKLKDMLAVA